MQPRKSILARLRGRPAAVVVVTLLTAGTAVLATSQLLEFEVVEWRWDEAAGAFAVSTVHPGTGLPLRFTLDQRVFRGQDFYADLEGVEAGDLFSLQGPPKLFLEARELTYLEPEGDYSPRSSAPRPGGRPRGLERFTVVTIDGARSRASAISKSGTLIEFAVERDAWKGYAIAVAPAHLATGKGFRFSALNAAPVENCCRLVSRSD